ncbi:hypothetical protein [Haloprofundus halobius]|uniref:hypothetical protein n=1 Tax=Haloprofundus halobius TaxID=2876194 RepID=UPI001CC9D888|nr:hypothetical protein [Haloprofundus halobius]
MTSEDAVPARGEPISVSGTVEEDHPGRFEYDEATGELRYPEVMDANGPVRYGTAPYERLAGMKAGGLAVRRVEAVTMERLDTDERIAGGVGSIDGKPVARIGISTRLNREGEVVHRPSITLDEIAAAAPREVYTTVEWLGRTHSVTVPVVVREGESQPL